MEIITQKHKCPECDCSYIMKKHLNYHIRRKHSYKVDEPCAKPQPEPEKPRNFVCSECELSYFRRKYLLAHVRRKHSGKVDELCSYQEIHSNDDTIIIKIEPEGIGLKTEDSFVDQTEVEVKLPVCYSCQYCERMFIHKRNIRPHIYKKHPEMMSKAKPDTSNYFPCELCARRFKYKKNLNAHIRSKHPEVKILPFRKLDDLKYPCHLCTRKFKYKRNLYAHTRNVHFNADFSKSRTTSTNFSCDICSRGFMYRKNLLSHVKQKHLLDVVDKVIGTCNEDLQVILNDPANYSIDKSISVNYNKKCPLCEFSASHKLPLIRHFTNVHGVQLDISNWEFDDMETFQKWKGEVEAESNCRFVKISNGKYTDHTTIIYQCHRSGRYRARGSGSRFMKWQSTKKLNAYCPAQIQLITWENNGMKVRFTRTHVGHDNELCHLSLEPEDQRNIAEKLASGISPDEMMADAASTRNFGKRKSYIDLKDIHNIKTRYLITATERQPRNDEVMNLDDWITNHHDFVLYYKKQGAPPPFETKLSDDDMVLIVMSDLQKEIICQFGQNIVCVHCVQNPEKYAFVCTAVTVVDEYSEGFAVAFLFSNRIDLEIYQIFFQCISDTVGLLQPDIFMSEKDTELCKAWMETMLPANKNLFCSSHILQDWKQKAVSIQNEEKRESILKILEYQILKEINYEALEDALNSFIECVDDDVKEFKQYFLENYMETISSWACCFRQEVKVNSNSMTEAFYQVLKLANAKEESSVVSLEEALHAVEKYLIYKKKNREMASMKQFKHSKRIAEIKKMHKKALSVNAGEDNIIKTDEGWLLPSLSPDDENSEMFMIREFQYPLCRDCELVCPNCCVCIHQYSCTCVDSSVKLIMCEHIHFLCNFLRNQDGYNNIEHIVDENFGIDDFNITNDFSS